MGRNGCPGIVFACIYKAWFRYHNNMPNIGFNRFFANPIRLSAGGPPGIPGILKLHAQLCEDAAVVLDSMKSGPVDSLPRPWRHLQHYHILPLCRAIVVLLD